MGPARPCRPGPASRRAEHQAAVHRSPGAVGYHIQQPTPLQVDQAGHPSGGRDPGRLEEAGLVQAKGGDTVQARGVVHQRSAVVSHRSHDGRPANPQVTGDRGDRVGVLADPPTRLGPRPLGQHRPRSDPSHPLGPGPHPTGRLPTAPDPLAPAQHDRPTTDRQIAYPDRAAAVELGPHPAAPTANHRGRGLDLELPLTGHDLRGQDLKAIQAEQRRPRRTTVLTHLGPPLAGRQTSTRYARPQVPLWKPYGAVSGTSPTLHDEEPVMGPLVASKRLRPERSRTASCPAGRPQSGLYRRRLRRVPPGRRRRRGPAGAGGRSRLPSHRSPASRGSRPRWHAPCAPTPSRQSPACSGPASRQTA
jgi:hypothetical protein